MMASNSLHPHHSLHQRRYYSTDFHSSSSSPHFLRLIPSSNSTTFTTTTISISPSSSNSTNTVLTPPQVSLSSEDATIASSSSSSCSFEILRQHLSRKDFRQADEETRRLLIVLAGEAAQVRGYVFFSEVQFIPSSDLKAIDELWKEHSGGKFGYSVQKKIFQKANRDFTSFFIRVGWMKKLDTEVEQYNYRSFPNEFIWEFNPEDQTQTQTQTPPEGHLPLTNALRGTQLLSSIFSHPAFLEEDDDEEANLTDGEEDKRDTASLKLKPLSNVFKTDYSF